MRLKIEHITRYSFDSPVTFGLQQLRKWPKSNATQRVLDWTTQVEGGTCELSFTDHHNNHVELISFDRDVTELVVSCEGTVEMADTGGVLGPHPGPAPLWLYQCDTDRTKAGDGVRALVRTVPDGTDIERLHALMGLIRDSVEYEIGASHPDWSAEEALSAASGVCQDHAHVFLAAARAMGFPARYVSGYLMLNDRIRQDAMHAWAEAHVDGLGWVGFDVSNGISPDVRYIRVATGLDYADAAPVTGTRAGGTGESLDVEIHVAQQ